MSRITFLSPTGIENFGQSTFCGLLCGGMIEEYLDDGLNLNDVRWPGFHLPVHPEMIFSEEDFFSCE